MLRLSWVVLVGFNFLLTFWTLGNFRRRWSPIKYSYLDGDRPFVMPVGQIEPVEMTFHESSRFGLTSNDSKASWDTVWSNQFGLGYQHFGPFGYRSLSGMYHALHCLWTMELDLDNPNHSTGPARTHFSHCLFLIRQYFLCNADPALEKGDFTQRNFTADRVGETRVCRDWDAVADWVNDEFKSWLQTQGLKGDEEELTELRKMVDEIGDSPRFGMHTKTGNP